MQVAKRPDYTVQQPGQLIQDINLMLQVMSLSPSDELAKAYLAVLTIFNGEK